jgi:ankyrin repeat protein
MFDEDSKDDAGMTPIHWAAGRGETTGLLALLKMGAAIETKAGPLKGTALHIAAAMHQEAAVQILLDKGANTETRFAGGGTALHLAVMDPGPRMA